MKLQYTALVLFFGVCALSRATPMPVQSSPTFAPRMARFLPQPEGSTIALVNADIDGDGDLDLAMNREADPLGFHAVRIYENLGNGVFSDVSTKRLPNPLIIGGDLLFADVDQDGDPDLLILNGPDLGVADFNRLFINDGTGNFTERDLPPIGPSVAMEAFDADSDGDLDLIIATGPTQLAFTGSMPTLLLNDGSGNFTNATATNMPSVLLNARRILPLDVDSDNDLDLYLATSFINPVTGFPPAPDLVYINDGSGVFTDSGVGVVGSSPFASDAGLLDVNLDGIDDVIVFESGSLGPTLLVGDGVGGFINQSDTLAPDFATGNDFAIGDVTGDGLVDIYIATGSQNQLFAGQPTGGFTNSTSILPLDTDVSGSVTLGDLDGNGSLDIVTGALRTPSRPWSRDRIHLNLGKSSLENSEFQLDPRYPLAPERLREPSLATGDVNGDGNLDIVMTDRFGANALLIGDGDGGLFQAPPTQFPMLNGNSNDSELFDMDRDGDLDLWVVNGGFAAFETMDTILINDGSGFFTNETSTRLEPNMDRGTQIAVGDVDSDGDLDVALALGDIPLQPNRLYVNDGAGIFLANLDALPPFNGRSRDIEFADLNGDQNLDLVVADLEGNQIWINDGTGTFQDETILRFPALPLLAGAQLDTGDIDGDADVDLFFGNHFLMPPSRVFTNDGLGFFSDETSTSLPGISLLVGTAELADLDADGDLDAVVGDILGGNGGVRVLINNGSGQFVEDPVTLTDDEAPDIDVALVDLDRDQDIDILVTRSTSTSIDDGIQQALLNQTRDWRSLDAPRLGFTYSIRVRSALGAGSFALPFFNISPAEPRIFTGFGEIGVSLAGVTLLQTLTIGADNSAVLALPVPLVTALAGLPIYTQALTFESGVGSSPRLTNRQLDVIR